MCTPNDTNYKRFLLHTLNRLVGYKIYIYIITAEDIKTIVMNYTLFYQRNFDTIIYYLFHNFLYIHRYHYHNNYTGY